MSRKGMLSLGLVITLLSLCLIAVGCAYTEPAEGGGFDWSFLVIMGIVFAAFYFLLIRPQRKRQKEQQDMQESLKKGSRVITAGGIYGVVEKVSEDSVVIKVDSGATLRVARGSITARQQ